MPLEAKVTSSGEREKEYCKYECLLSSDVQNYLLVTDHLKLAEFLRVYNLIFQ